MPFHDDPLLRRWALDVAVDTVFVSPANRDRLLDTILPESALGDLVDRIDQEELASLIFHLPEDRWAAHADLLAEQWAGWNGRLAEGAARLIAHFRPEAAIPLFGSFIEGVADHGAPDVLKLVGVIRSLRDLSGDQVRELVTAAARIVEQRDDLEFTDWQYAVLAEAALKVGHPERIRLVGEWLRRTASSERTLNEAVVRVGEWLFGDASRVGYVRDYAAGYTRQTVTPLADVVYRPDIPLVEIDNALRGLVVNDARSAHRLLEQHLEATGGGDLPEHWGDFVALVRAGIPQPEGRAAKRVWAEVFGLGGLLTSLWRPRLDLSDADLGTIWKVVAADTDLPPGLETAVPRLRESPREAAVQKLIGIAQAGDDTYAGQHASILMGLLAYDEFLPSLIDCLDGEFEPAQEAAEAALERFGDRAIAALDADFDDLEGFQHVMAVALASRVGGEAGAALIAKRFTVLVDEDPDAVAMAASVLDAEPLNTLLTEWLDEDVPELNRAFAVLAKLHGRDGDPEYRDLIAKVERQDAETAEREAAAFKGEEPGYVGSTPLMPLTCRTCGQTRTYDIREVWITADPADLKPFIAQDVPCTSCGAISNFDFTPDALETIGAEAQRLGLNDLETYRFRDRWSFLKVRYFDGPAGVRRSITDLIEEFEQHLAANPNDAANHRSVGNLFIDTNRYTAAEEHFRRCREIDATYLEAYYGLAQVAEYRGNSNEALDLLVEGAKHGGTLACRRPVGWPTPAEFVSDYIRLYHDIGGDATGRLKITPTQFKTKLGRNDPCPLGTGKKVKKCCGGGN